MNIEEKFITECYKGDNLNITFQNQSNFVENTESLSNKCP